MLFTCLSLSIFVVCAVCEKTDPMTYHLYLEQCAEVMCSSVYINTTTLYNLRDNSMEVNVTCSEPLPLDPEENMRPWWIEFSVSLVPDETVHGPCNSTPIQVFPIDGSKIILRAVDSWIPGSARMSAILYLKLSSDTLSLSNESNSAVVDLDVRCSTDQTKVMKVCLCEDPGLADRYCRNVTDVEFKRKFRWQEYHLYGKVHNKFHEPFEYYTSILSSDTSSVNYNFRCNDVFPKLPDRYSDFHYTLGELAVGTMNTPKSASDAVEYDYLCAVDSHGNEPFHMTFNAVKVHLSYIDVTYDDVGTKAKYHPEQEIRNFPIDIGRWKEKLNDGDCIVVELSGFSRYCYCAATNKSEKLCRSIEQSTVVGMESWKNESGNRQDGSENKDPRNNSVPDVDHKSTPDFDSLHEAPGYGDEDDWRIKTPVYLSSLCQPPNI
ncbi:hypothetical protein DdX_15860 [Ditylenchus destructor]|uniref:Secreted protein n=1 Tax=Ditylenchus destructor TaxID=166010 RepID=A0AAD4MNU9_9BILA|nr:hypothetical protein DdX_15860 [Ditylenchus destructor]